MKSQNIPTAADFARASAAIKKYDRGLSEVRDQISKRFGDLGLHEVFVFYSPANNLFVAHLFYHRNEQIATAEKSGLSSQIKHAVIEELVRVGRGKTNTIKIEFHFDSHENVDANFEGDYFLRLR